jgi:spore germination protein
MDNSKISTRQMQTLIILYIFGFGILSLPRAAAQSAAQNGWMGVVLATVAAMAAVCVIVTLALRSGKRRFPEFANHLLGKPLGKLVCLLFSLRLISLAGVRLHTFNESVREYMLPQTPAWIILAAMLITCVYAAVKKFEIQARLAEILIFFMLIPLIYVFLVALRGADYSNLLPISGVVPADVIRGSSHAIYSFTGIELLLLIIPFINKRRGIGMSAVSTIAVLGLLMALTVIITTAVFGADSVARKVWPVFQMMDAAEIPGRFFERQGAFVMCFWIISAFAAISAEIFFASLLLKDVVNIGKRRWYVLAITLLIFALALFNAHLPAVISNTRRLDLVAGTAFMFVIPFIMLIISNFRKGPADDD